jgi:hypothetical protein
MNRLFAAVGRAVWRGVPLVVCLVAALLAVILPALVGLSEAHAQRRIRVERLATEPIAVGEVVEVRLPPFDDALALDPDVLELDPRTVRAGSGELGLLAVGPGVGTIMVLRGGQTESIVVTVSGSTTQREQFEPSSFATIDGVPSWTARSNTLLVGRSDTAPSLTQTLGAGIGYRSDAAGIVHRTGALVQSEAPGWGLRQVGSTTQTRRFDFTLGDFVVAPAPGRVAFGMRGATMAVRPLPGEDGGPLQLDLSAGNTWQLNCCSPFDANGEVVATGGASVDYGPASSRVSAGVIVPRRDPEVLPLLTFEQALSAGPLYARASLARIGDGVAGTWSATLRSDRTRGQLVGYHSGVGTWLPTLGRSTTAQTFAAGNLQHQVSDPLALSVDANLRDSRAGPLPALTTAVVGAGATYGIGTRLGVRYGLGFGWERGVASQEQLRHIGQVSLATAGSKRFRMNGTALAAFDSELRFRQLNTRFQALSEVGPVARVGPFAWAAVNDISGGGGIGSRLRLERARVALDSGLGLQAFGTPSKLTVQPQLDSELRWAFASWGTVVTSGSLNAPIRDEPALGYSAQVGFEVGGNLRDVRGLFTGGGTVSGVAFVDTDGDGILGDNDYGVQGVEVTILDRTVVTGPGGTYKLRGLDPATYGMSVDAQSYLLAIDAPSATVLGLRPVQLDLPLVERRRLDINVFADLDGDGELEVGEWGVDAEMVSITGEGGSQTVQVPDGRRTIEGLETGRYEVELFGAMLDARYLPTGRTKKTVYVDQRGFQRVTFSVRPVRKLSGKVCRDANGNERLDGADPCEAGIQVRLSTGEVVMSASGGRFTFEPVPPGEHTLTAEGTEIGPYRFTKTPESKTDLVLLLPLTDIPAPSPTPDAESDAELIALRLEVDEQRLKVGERMEFGVTATFDNLMQIELEKPALSISDERVLRREGDELVAVGEGTARVTVIQGDVSSPPIDIDVQRLPVVGLIARPSRIEIPFGEVQQVGATAIFVDGDSQDVGSRVEWRCDDPQVCRVEGNGVFVAVGPGTSVLRARYLGVSSQPIEVRVTTGDALPTKMVVSPPQLTLGIQSTGRVYVDADLSNGRQVHLTTEVEWETDAPDVIEVLPGGRIRPMGIGRATVTATYKGVQSVASTIEVVPAVGLVVVPTVGVVPAGVSVPVKLYEVLGDGSFAEANRAKWSSDAPAVAEVVDGVVKTNQIGVASLTAKYRGNTSLPMEVRVVGSGLGGLRSSTERLVLNPGDVSYVDAVASFRDGTETVATSVTEWTVSNPAVATVSEDGEIRAMAPGRAIIRGSWLGWSTAPIEVLVGAGVSDVPSAILVEPGSVSLSAQGRQPLAVTMLSEDGRLLSAEGVRWEIADPSVAWVEKNEIRAVAVGATEIVAVVGDVRSLPVPVEVAPIVGVTAAPALGRLPVGARVDLKAVGVVGNGEIEELNDGVRWQSSDPDVLQIDSKGELLAFRAGRAEVTATWRGMQTMSMPVEVSDTDIESLAIEPDGASIRVDERLPLAVVAVFGDGATADATPHVTWTSTRPGVAQAEDGLLVGLEPGVAEVFATWMGVKSDPVRVNVAPADAVGVIIGNASETMLVGRRQPLKATAVTADGLLLDATEQTLWGVEDDAVVTVDANGYIEARSAGETTVVGIVAGEESPPIGVEVLDVAVVRVDLEPGAIALQPGEPVEIRATATLQDGRTVDVTRQVDWEIDGRGVAVDRYNRLQVVAGARARVRARIQSESEDIRSGWAEIVTETGTPQK